MRMVVDEQTRSITDVDRPISVPAAHPGLALAAALLGFFVITLDAVRGDLGGGMTGLQWVVDGYTLMFAALLLSAGSLSDRIGARRAFGAGLALFIVASVGCGLAPSLGALAVAVFGALLAHPATFMQGLRSSLLIAAGVALATAAASLTLRSVRQMAHE